MAKKAELDSSDDRDHHPDSAQAVAMLLAVGDPASWIHRRVESLSFLADGSTRRRVSFDFSLPLAFVDFGFVPIAILAKRTLHSLDVISASGSALSVLTKTEGADVAMALLASGISRTQSDKEIELLADIVYFESDVTGNLRRTPADLCGEYKDILDSKYVEPCSDLAVLLISNFILWVQVPKGSQSGDRLVVKISYEETLPLIGGVLPTTIETEFNLAWCSRFHFEVTAPLPLKVSFLNLTIDGAPTEPREPDAISGSMSTRHSLQGARVELGSSIVDSTQVAHLAVDGDKEATHPRAEFGILADRNGIPKIAFYVSLGLCILFIHPVVVHLLGFHYFSRPSDGSSASLLLLGPALLVTYLARPSEHPIVSDRLRGARYSLLFSGSLMMAAAAIVGGVLGAMSPYLCWFVLGIFSVIGLFGIVRWRSAATI